MMAPASVEFSVAAVETDGRARARLVRLLKEAVDPVQHASIDAMEESDDFRSPWIVVAGPSYADATGLKAIQVFTRRRPEVGVILVVEELSTELLQEALRAGVRDVVSRPKELAPLADAIERVAETLGGRPRAHDARPLDPRRGRVVTILAAKGGAGKSVLASNLGVSLARRCEKPVALVDADLQFGDSAVLLRLSPDRTIVDVLSVIPRLDADLLRQLLLRHEPSGLLILAAPIEPAFADQVSAEDLMRIVHVLQSFCQIVVIDTPAQLNDIVLAAVEEADDVVLVCSPEIPNVKNAKLALQTLSLLNVPSRKINLVVNRARRNGNLDVADVERVLELAAKAVIPADDAIPHSVNAGVPAVLSAPRSHAARALEKLAALIASPTGSAG